MAKVTGGIAALSRFGLCFTDLAKPLSVVVFNDAYWVESDGGVEPGQDSRIGMRTGVKPLTCHCRYTGSTMKSLGPAARFAPPNSMIPLHEVKRSRKVIQNSDFYFEVEDSKTKLMKEMPYELLKDEQKKQLKKNNEAKMTLYNALPCNSQVENCKIDLLTQEYEKFSISNEETINSGFTRFNAFVTSLKSLDLDYSSKYQVRKFLRALPSKWRAKVTAIKEAKDLGTLSLDELISNLKVYETILGSDDVASKPIKEKVIPIALKANITKGQTSNKSTCQYESDEDEEINLMAKTLENYFKKVSRNMRSSTYAKRRLKVARAQDVNAVAWSDSEDGDEPQNDATCLMEFNSQEVRREHDSLKEHRIMDNGCTNHNNIYGRPLYAYPLNQDKHIIPKSKVLNLGNSQVNDNKIDLLVQQYEQFTILEEEYIDSGFARFNTIITSLKAFDECFSSKNYVKTFLRALHPKWRAKVMAIEESKDLSSLALDERQSKSLPAIRIFLLIRSLAGTTKSDALLTTYEVLLKDKTLQSTIKWKYLMVDEAHRLKNGEALLLIALKEFSTKTSFLLLALPYKTVLKNYDGEKLEMIKEKVGHEWCRSKAFSYAYGGILHSVQEDIRVYNKRTRLIVESIHLRFDEIKEMFEKSIANYDFRHRSSKTTKGGQIMTTLTTRYQNYKNISPSQA
ncbi:DUF4219 domain-containing protein [Tanacetum coccineum]